MLGKVTVRESERMLGALPGSQDLDPVVVAGQRFPEAPGEM